VAASGGWYAEVIAVRHVEAHAGRDQHVLLLEQVERELLVVQNPACGRSGPQRRLRIFLTTSKFTLDCSSRSTCWSRPA